MMSDENKNTNTGKSNIPEITPERRKINSFLFILGATALNIAVMLVVFLVLYVLYAKFLAQYVSQDFSAVAIVVIFFGSVASSYVFYHFFIKWLSKKLDLDKYFDPIFQVGRRKK